MNFIIKIVSFLGFVKKPLTLLNGVLDSPNWKRKWASISGMLIAAVALVNEAMALVPLDLNEILALSKSEHALAFVAAFYLYGEAKKSERMENKI